MELLIPHECHRCGVVDEAKFTFAGPHIKQVCNNCNSYVKFFNKSWVPDKTEIKLRIWAITQCTSTLASLKKEIGFIDTGLTPLEEKMQYWRLYLKVRSTFASKESEASCQ